MAVGDEPTPGDTLVPARHGHLLRRVEWTRPWLLLPPGARGCLLPISILAALSIVTGVLTTALSPQLLLWVYGTAMLPILTAPVLADSRVRRLFNRRSALHSLAGRRRGDMVKIRGRVAAGPTFETMGLRRPAVMASYAGTVTYVTGHITDGLSRPLHETRGLDFSVELANGERIVVRPSGAYFLSQPPETRRLFWGRNMEGLPTPLRRLARLDAQGAVNETILGETSLSPGEEVEVLGVLDHEVSPEASAAGRGARLQAVLRAGPLTPLLIRRSADEDEQA
ncbi:MAG TPA: hypothetical protein VGG33_21375 [Polyangia bacterium]